MVSLFVVIMMFCYVIEKGFGIMKGLGNRGFLCDREVYSFGYKVPCKCDGCDVFTDWRILVLQILNQSEVYSITTEAYLIQNLSKFS